MQYYYMLLNYRQRGNCFGFNFELQLQSWGGFGIIFWAVIPGYLPQFFKHYCTKFLHGAQASGGDHSFLDNRGASPMATGSSFQSSIRQFSVPARLASQTREQREAAEAERAAARKARADALGLAWPRVHKQRAGRPSWQQLWKAALYEAIATDRPFADDLTKEVPLWWRPGLGLVRTIDAVQEDMREAPAGKQAVKQQAVNQEDKHEIITSAEGNPDLDGLMRRSVLKPTLVAWVYAARVELSVRAGLYTNGWKHLAACEADLPALLDRARVANAAGTLFRKGRGLAGPLGGRTAAR